MMLEVKGSYIYSIQNGNAEDQMVFYLHGNLGSSRWFSRVMELPGFFTFALDLPNFGVSDSINAIDIDTYADYAVNALNIILKETGNRSTVIVGHSLGGAVAVSLAVRYREFVDKLILIDPPPLKGLITPEEHYPVIERYKTSRALLKEALRAVTPAMNDDVLLNELTDDALKMKKEAFTGHAKSLENFNYSDKVSDFRKEVLVLVGEKDILITKSMGMAVARSFPCGNFKLIENVGHSLMVENPVLFKDLLLHFIAVNK